MTAAGSFSNDFSTLNNKRKRLCDDNEITNDYDTAFSKRRNLNQLPIRSPPRPSIAITAPFGSTHVPPGTLTPDSIPEEVVGTASPLRQHSDSTSSNGSTNASVASNTSNDSKNAEVDMELSSPPQAHGRIPTPIKIGRARSNDLMSPARSSTMPHLMSPSNGGLGRDRLPTPVASTFPARSPFEASFASAAARNLWPSNKMTTLSPMVDAESWTPRMQRPPSPDPELDACCDEDSMMEGMEDSYAMSSSFSSLSVHARDMTEEWSDSRSNPPRTWLGRASTSPQTRGLGLDSASTVPRPDDLRMSTIDDRQSRASPHTRNQSSGRTARLHMGFRADCEKCVARVPGHYSHILWT